MIITPHFVWTHMAKTGGSVVHKIIEQLGDPEIELDPMTGEWSDYRRHEPFWLRSEKVGYDITSEKLKALTIRRLPSWLLSMSEFKLATAGFKYTHNDLVEGMFRHEKRDMSDGSLNNPGDFEISHADEALAFYQPETIDIWWKQESLSDDVIKTLRAYYKISPTMEKEMRKFEINVNEYDHNLNHHFTSADLEQLYHNCPLWTLYEKKIYGDLLV